MNQKSTNNVSAEDCGFGCQSQVIVFYYACYSEQLSQYETFILFNVPQRLPAVSLRGPPVSLRGPPVSPPSDPDPAGPSSDPDPPGPPSDPPGPPSDPDPLGPPSDPPGPPSQRPTPPQGQCHSPRLLRAGSSSRLSQKQIM